MTRTRLSAEERRRQITVEAIEEFAAKGFAATTTDAIARRAGVSQPYVFRLFPSKTALFIAASQNVFEQMGAQLEIIGRESATTAGSPCVTACRAALADGVNSLFLVQLYSVACIDAEVRAVAAQGFSQLCAHLLALLENDIALVRTLVAHALMSRIHITFEVCDYPQRGLQLAREPT
ncbi:TetR/AcrR family transcriptional regulator [Nocardia sp. NPDC056000]|uniref:TetR/AcrR family transcriptional regulator n=1 Tax=Nocardia sp. NPDC056000 TaxID=3345674 RepID=UPI0035D8041B